MFEGDQATIKASTIGLTTTETTSSEPTKTTNPATAATKMETTTITAKTSYPTSNHRGKTI